MIRLHCSRLVLSSFAALAMTMAAGTPAYAARVVQFEILLEGKVVLSGMSGDKGEASANQVWEYLRTLEFQRPNPEFQPLEDRPAADFKIEPDSKDPLRATLSGKIRIFARYGGDVELTTLQLVRKSDKSDKWTLTSAEVDRTAKLRKVDPAMRARRQVR